MTSGILIAAGFAAVVIVEIVFSARWNRTYFTAGLPIFVRRIERSHGIEAVPLEILERASATAAGKPFTFRRLGPDLIAFREGALAFQYVPIMRGSISMTSGEPSVVVKGLVNWFVVALVVGLVVLLRGNVRYVAPYLLGALAVVYLIQAVRYGRVAKALREASPPPSPPTPPPAPPAPARR